MNIIQENNDAKAIRYVYNMLCACPFFRYITWTARIPEFHDGEKIRPERQPTLFFRDWVNNVHYLTLHQDFIDESVRTHLFQRHKKTPSRQ